MFDMTNPNSKTTAGGGGDPSSQLHQRWNTKNLGARLATDLVSAACATALIAPIITIIDKSIMENASGRNTLASSIKSSLRQLALRPHTLVFSKPVALIFCLYGGTYLTANTLDTATSTLRSKPATHVTSGPLKFAASSSANIGLCIYKDAVFVKLFGPTTPGAPRPVTLPSYALFTLRDCLTIFASFNVPPLLGPILSSRMGSDLQRHISGQTVAQFVAPAAVQLLSTPLHLLGLDIYNRPSVPRPSSVAMGFYSSSSSSPSPAATLSAGGGSSSIGSSSTVSWADRWDLVRKNWAISSAARICRIVPAFGIGGTVNMKVRRNLMERFT